jgi:DNA-directed RNA polymerase subunit omega
VPATNTLVNNTFFGNDMGLIVKKQNAGTLEDYMIDELREEEIVAKVGGRFKLSTLIQKRLVALNSGSRPLVDTKSEDKIQIVIQEILQDKIYLDTDANLRIAESQKKAEELDFTQL